jgi:hypothetical protein
MEGWTVDIDAVGDAETAGDDFLERLDVFSRELEPYSGGVAGDVEEGRYGARFSIDTESVNPIEILELGLEIFHDAAVHAGMPSWQVVHCEILTYAEDDAEQDLDDQ